VPDSNLNHLIVGKDSLLGTAIATALSSKGRSVIATTRRGATGSHHLDLALPLDRTSLPRASVAYLCAAITSIAACEKDPVATAKINVAGMIALAEALIANGTFVVFLSTNLVFDGTQPFVPADAAPSPSTAYGRQKAEVERYLLQFGSNAAILRLSKVIGPATALFAGWRQKLDRGEAITPFHDMVMSPVSAPFAAGALVRIGEARKGGLYQLSADRDVSYAEAASWMAQVRGGTHLAIPSSARGTGIDSKSIVSHTTMDSSRLARELDVFAPDPRDAMLPFL
jgi:dTDP-4-dehydrorhamnose reductase